jgi:hypothetical protein
MLRPINTSSFLHLVGYLFTFMIQDARSHEIKTPFPISSVYGAFLASHTHHRNLVLGNRGSDDSSKKIVCLTAWYSKLISKLMLLRSLERQQRKAGCISEKCLISYRSQGSLRSWASSAAALPGFWTFYSCKGKQISRTSILSLRQFI